MSLQKDSLSDEILSRSEKAVIRGIYRAYQLSEGIVFLDKISTATRNNAHSAESAVQGLVNAGLNTDKLKSYLVQQIASVLSSTKVPAMTNVQVSQNSEKPNE